MITRDESLPDWLVRAVAEASERRIGDLVLVAIGSAASADVPRSRLATLWRRRSFVGFSLLRWLDDRLLRQSRIIDQPLAAWAPGIPRLSVTLTAGPGGEGLSASDTDQLRQHRLDVVIQAWSGPLSGEGLGEIATHGLWSFHHGDDARHGGPAGVWEVLEDRTTTAVSLRRHDGSGAAGVPLARTVAKTRRFSFARNADALHPRSARILLRSLQRAHERGDPRQFSVADDTTGDAGSAPVQGEPTNRDVLRHLPRVAAHFLARRIRWAGRQARWTLAWHFEPGISGNAPNRSLLQYREIPAPRGHFWADPFVVRHRDRWWLFFEDFSATTRTGVIRVCEIGAAGLIGEPRLALDGPYHLSYPCVFEHDGAWFMLPETKTAGRVELYRAVRFPFEWAFERALIEGVTAVDATIHELNGRWYLFTSVAEPGTDSTEELHLFVADELFGPFAPHPASPVVTDVRRARMAGRLFTHEGRLNRPAQSAVPEYGSAVVVHEVLELTPTAYAERPVYELTPGFKRGVLGLHTINAMDGLSIIDLNRPG